MKKGSGIALFVVWVLALVFVAVKWQAKVLREEGERVEVEQRAEEKAERAEQAELDAYLRARKGGFRALCSYVQKHPDGKYGNDARAALEVVLKDKSYSGQSLSYDELKRCIRQLEGEELGALAIEALKELCMDWSWVDRQENLYCYKQFIALKPQDVRVSLAEKRIIELEIDEIAAGDHGIMPKAEPLSYGGGVARVTIENDTGYVLTVRYSGPTTDKLVIAKGGTGRISLDPGAYRVAASVNAVSVSNYFGNEEMKGGEYSSTFYIQSSRFPIYPGIGR